MENNDQYSTSIQQSVFKEVDTEDFDKQYDNNKILRGIQRFIPLVIATTLFFGCLGGYYTWYNLTNYKAVAYLLYHQGVIGKDEQSVYNLTELTLPTTVDLILNPSHVEAIISILGLDIDSRDLLETLEVPIPKKKSNVIQVIANADNPNLAIDIANTLARVSVRSAKDYLQNQFHKSLNSFKKELTGVRNKLSVENKQIEEFKKINQYLEMGADYNMIITDMLSAKEQLERARVEYDSLLVQYENLKRGIGNLPESIAIGIEGSMSPISSQIMQLKANLSDAKARYTESNPKVLRLQDQINELMGTTQETDAQEGSVNADPTDRTRTNIDLMKMQATVRAAQKRKEYLEERLGTIEEAVKDVPAEQMKLAKLLHTKEITESRLSSLEKNYNLILLKLNNPQGNLELYISAEKAVPKNEKKLTYLMPIIGIIFGLGFGLVLAYILELLDNKLRTKKQVEIYYTPPLFSLIPQIKHLRKRNAEKKLIFFIRQISDRLLNYERKIREQSTTSEQKGLCLGMVSCHDGEGKSTILLELAKYLRKIKKTAVLVELDPKTYSNEGSVVDKNRLTAYLSEQSEMGDLITDKDPVVIKLGYVDAGLTELVKSPRLITLFTELKQRFEYVLVDIPGIFEEEFGVYVAGLCDSTFMMIDSSQTSKSKVDVALEELQSMDVIPSGIILNNVSKLYVDSDKLLKEMKIANNI
jgi:polysaccharide biosynthesis transport protein